MCSILSSSYLSISLVRRSLRQCPSGIPHIPRACGRTSHDCSSVPMALERPVELLTCCYLGHRHVLVSGLETSTSIYALCTSPNLLFHEVWDVEAHPLHFIGTQPAAQKVGPAQAMVRYKIYRSRFRTHG
jgi:hypothetical protein